MKPFDRIVITGDLMRPFPSGSAWVSATAKNIRWLRQVLGPALQATGLPLSMLAWDERMQRHEGRFFDAPVVASRTIEQHEGRAPSPTHSLEAWAAWTDRLPVDSSFIEALAPELEGALVIGYEMPPAMIDALQTLGRPWVDVVLHPVRFMPDLVFALRTNLPQWHEVFLQHQLQEEAMTRQAAWIAAKVAWMAPPESLTPGCALLLGQVGIDRAVVSAGRFASLADHLSTLHALCVEHPQVLFKPHPYGVGPDRSAQAVAAFAAIQSTQANFYHLVAQPEVELVVALNSSGLHEARHFGKQARSLIDPLHDFDAKRPPSRERPGDPVAQTQDWLTAAFWTDVLSAPAGSPQLERRAGIASSQRNGQTRARAPELIANLLRRSMNADWGYGFIERICA